MLLRKKKGRNPSSDKRLPRIKKKTYSRQFNKGYDAGFDAGFARGIHEGYHDAVAETGCLQSGINLIGYTRTEIGIGEGSRLMARAFEAADIPFLILHYTDPAVQSASNTDMSWAHKEADAPLYRVNYFHMNADSLIGAYQRLGREIIVNRYNIGYWAWELPELPDDWRRGFDTLQEVWVPSHFVAEAISKKSPIPVLRIPHAIEVRNAAVNRDAFGLPSNSYLFLTMYDTHSYMERKNPGGSIEAFKRAFAPKDPSVGLVLKINNADPSQNEQLRQQIGEYNNIYLITETMSRDAVNTLISSTDCYVSLHRSEGFGLVMAEAMYLGKPVIGTNWSGNTDYMNSDNCCTVNYQLVRIGKDVGPYKAHQIWAEPDIDHAAHYMKKLVHDSGWRNRIARQGQHTIHTQFSPHAVGEMVKQRLQSLALL